MFTVTTNFAICLTFQRMAAPPLGLLLASLAPLVLEFDPEQWRAWQQFSNTDQKFEHADEKLAARLLKELEKNASKESDLVLHSEPLESEGSTSGFGPGILDSHEREDEQKILKNMQIEQRFQRNLQSLVNRMNKKEPPEKAPKVSFRDPGSLILYHPIFVLMCFSRSCHKVLNQFIFP